MGSRSGFDQGTTRASRVVAFRASRVVTFWASRVVTSSFLSLALRTFSAFLAPVPIDERKDPLGPHASRNGKRSSDKGFLAMAEAEYLEILDWLARDEIVGKRGSTPRTVPPVLEGLGIEPTLWSTMVKDFGRTFMNVAGTAKSVSEARSLKTHRKFYLARV